MNLVNILPFLFLHVLSLEFSRLAVTSDSCQRLLRSEGFEPNCKFETSKSAGPLEVSCPEAEVLRIVGDYDVIRIDCQAPFLFHFDFAGNKPTEAIVPELYRRLNASSERWDFHIQVLIYGLNALARAHNNSDQKHDYSRTGRFSFQGLGSFARFAKSFYMFLEEPGISANFIENRDTEWPRFEDSNVCVNILCLPTHFQSVVRLASPKLPGVTFIYKPTAGLQICGLSVQVEAFVCQLEGSGSGGRKTVESVPSSPYGFPRPLTLDSSGDIKISYNSKWRDSTTVETNAECGAGSGSSNLATIGTSNPASYGLLRDFVLPGFQSRSYTVRIGRNRAGGRLGTGTTTALAGATYCADNAGKYKLGSFAVDFEPSVAVLDFDIEWASFFASSGAKYSKIWPNGSEELEEGSNVNFTCKFNDFLFVPPALWHGGRADGEVRREWSNNSDTLKNGVSLLRLKVSKDLENITCNAPVWYSSSMEAARAGFSHVTIKSTTTATPTVSTTLATVPATSASTTTVTTTPTTTVATTQATAASPTITTSTTTTPTTTATTKTAATTATTSTPTTTVTTTTPTTTAPTSTSPLVTAATSTEAESLTTTTTTARTTMEPTTPLTTPSDDIITLLLYGIILALLAGLLLYFLLAGRHILGALCGCQYDVAAATRQFGSEPSMTNVAGHPAQMKNCASSSATLLAVGPVLAREGSFQDVIHLSELLSPANEELKGDVGSTDSKALPVFLAPLVSSEESLV